MCRLIPHEREALMKALDEDGGGEIDVAEFEVWWNSTPLVPNTKALQLWEKASEVRMLAGGVKKLDNNAGAKTPAEAGDVQGAAPQNIEGIGEQIPDASSG
jgi:hypothetical protein